MIRLLVDSASDIPMSEAREKNIALVPLTVMIGENSYKDQLELEPSALYEQLIAGNTDVKTAQPSPADFLDHFEEAKENGDELICIMLSSALSGTYQSACLAKNMADYDKIHIIDSLSGTVGVKIMVEKALSMIETGESVTSIVDTLEELKGRIRIKAAFDTLKYLYLGGRISKGAALIADTVNIKPSITITTEGKVEVTGKYLGMGRAAKDFAKQLKDANLDTSHPVYLIYSHDLGNVEKLKKNLDAAGIEVDGCYQLGAVIGVHAGPNVLGIVYVETSSRT